jgi:hypothetical protein
VDPDFESRQRPPAGVEEAYLEPGGRPHHKVEGANLSLAQAGHGLQRYVPLGFCED